MNLFLWSVAWPFSLNRCVFYKGGQISTPPPPSPKESIIMSKCDLPACLLSFVLIT